LLFEIIKFEEEKVSTAVEYIMSLFDKLADGNKNIDKDNFQEENMEEADKPKRDFNKNTEKRTEKNQIGLIQELVKTVQHLSSQLQQQSCQINSLEKTNNALCEKINTMDTFSKRPEAN